MSSPTAHVVWKPANDWKFRTEIFMFTLNRKDNHGDCSMFSFHLSLLIASLSSGTRILIIRIVLTNHSLQYQRHVARSMVATR